MLKCDHSIVFKAEFSSFHIKCTLSNYLLIRSKIYKKKLLVKLYHLSDSGMSSPRVAEDSVASSADDSSEVVLLKRRLRHTQQNIQFLQGSKLNIKILIQIDVLID